MHGGQKSKKKEMNEKQINEDNLKLKLRLMTVQPHLNHREFVKSYNKHLYYRERMEKFNIGTKQLKASENISNYERTSRDKYSHVPSKMNQSQESKSLEPDFYFTSVQSPQFNITQRYSRKNSVDIIDNYGLQNTLLDMIPIFQRQKKPLKLQCPTPQNILKERIRVNRNVSNSTNVSPPGMATQEFSSEKSNDLTSINYTYY